MGRWEHRAILEGNKGTRTHPEGSLIKKYDAMTCWSGFQMTVESNHTVTLGGFDFASVSHFLYNIMRNHSTNQKQSRYWY